MKFGKRHYRPQVDQMDCGVASLAMVFGYYGSYYFLAHLRELAKTTMMERRLWAWSRWQRRLVLRREPLRRI
ncbi:competence factor transporting ATP-binding protein/permease ComA [Streptococcus pneumoniae]|nr:competence factor transporting ATP-binding protein/permease ComA [Streptococcus pneumoniae]